MSKEKDDIEDILNKDINNEYNVTVPKEEKVTEDLEEHYKQMYKDLPPDVVKMLIDTHPLHKDSDKEYISKEDILKEEEISEEIPKTKVAAKESKKVERKKQKEFEYIDDNVDDIDEEEEKEFIYSLFSKSSDDESIDLKKYVAIAILTAISFVCIIGIVVNIIQNSKYKEQIEVLKAENAKLEAKVQTDEAVQKKQKEEIESYKEEIENYKVQSVPSDTQEPLPFEPNDAPSDSQIEEIPTSSSSTSTQKTYKVLSGDTLWKISQKQYGAGSQDYVNAIMNANGLKSANDIKPGMTLKIPEIGGK